MPRQLNNKLLASKSRDGSIYCALFQSQECKEEPVSLLRADGRQADCKFGLHKCAVLFKSCRTCHGNHPAINCEQTKRLAPIPVRGSVGSPNLLPRNPADGDDSTQYYAPNLVPPPKRRKEEPPGVVISRVADTMTFIAG